MRWLFLGAMAIVFCPSLLLADPGVDPGADPGFGSWNGKLVCLSEDWPAIRAMSKTDAATGQAVAAFLLRAETILARPVRRRVNRLEDLPPDGMERQRAVNTSEANRLPFALAMHDAATCTSLLLDMVDVAIAATMTGRQDMTDWVIGQLREAQTWRPLQRPGWTLYAPENTMPEGGDGVWLGTGYGLMGIASTLAILGDRVPADLRDALHSLMREEIARIRQDWRDRRPWYVAGNAYQSNQWIIPNLGMAMACLSLGDDRLRDAYDMAVGNIGLGLRAYGDDGAFIEGYGYACMTMPLLAETLRTMRLAGDMRLANMPFPRNNWIWATHMHMPGGYVVNVNDCGWWRNASCPTSAALSAVALAQPDARQAVLRSQFAAPATDRLGLLYARHMATLPTAPVDAASLPTFALFPSQMVLTWRSQWSSDRAWALWIRGGSPRDSHSHRDNGQLSVLLGDEPVLIEAGTPNYADLDLNVKYAQAAGHNILQPDEVLPRTLPVDVPIQIERLDDTGGSVTIQGTAVSTAARKWIRQVTWDRDARTMDVHDDAVFSHSIDAGQTWFRWHTGSAQPVTISGQGKQWSARWNGHTMTFHADTPIVVTQIDWPDASTADKHHACLLLACADVTDTLSVRLRLQLRDRTVSSDGK
ncbi:MAG: heparinase II/III family protein [Phycisphaeraceae bacterium]|nr:heparinase II/III family protein [Phycisphaeraceae bacterium]